MKLLVLTSEPITARELRDALTEGPAPEAAEVMVVAPALAESPIKFWLSDADDAIARAEQVRIQTAQRLGEEGVAASADTGESNPMDTIADALMTFPADRIVLFTHRSSEQRYREDLDPREVMERFGIPVDHAMVASHS